MPKKRLDVNWNREVRTEDFKPTLKRYDRYQEDNGLKKSTISSYVFRVGKFLEFAKDDAPQVDKFTKFHEVLHERKLSRSSINNYCFAIKKYYEMCGKSILPEVEMDAHLRDIWRR
jgi:site-specific recombinase XerD